MYTFRERRDKIIGEDLDDYLSKGWYRMGNTIFTCQFLLQKSELFSATWIRLGLRDFSFGKSNRKLISRNAKKFSYKVRLAEVTDEKEDLYQRYRDKFDGYISKTINENLYEANKQDVFDTWNIEVYDEEKLVALSFFDLGKASMASILGIYDPTYSKHSLGYYTLLLEIVEAQKLGMKYFYPGYIVHDNPRFDYKTKIGDVEYFDFIHKQWLPKDEFRGKEVLVNRLMDKLFEVHAYLKTVGIKNSVFLYPFYEASMFYFQEEGYLEHPVYIELGNNEKVKILIIFDLFENVYKVYECSRLIDVNPELALSNYTFQNIIMKERCILTSNSAIEMTEFIFSIF